jgi:hypothetical protein
MSAAIPGVVPALFLLVVVWEPTMVKLPLLTRFVLVGSLIVTATLAAQPLEELEWRWSKEKATLAYCMKRHMPDYAADPKREMKYGPELEVFDKDGRRTVWLFESGVKGNVFTRWKETIFVAHYCTIATGCEVEAIDLKTGKQLWKSRLEGIGPTGHSKYSNSVNIETDSVGSKVIICGNEGHGKYVEYLDMMTGKKIANRKFDLAGSK